MNDLRLNLLNQLEHRRLAFVAQYIRNLLEALALIAPFYKYQREAHHTFEAKLRNASTLLRLGRTSKLALLSP